MHEEVRGGHERWASLALVSAWCGDGFEQAMWQGLQETRWQEREAGLATLQAIREGHSRQRMLASWREGCRDLATARMARALENWPDREELARTWLALAERRSQARERRALGWLIVLVAGLVAVGWLR
jgi:hypothetical protein